MNSPVQMRTCPYCGGVMVATRTVPRFGVLPELNIFRCSACDEVVTIVENATSLVQIPAELGFI